MKPYPEFAFIKIDHKVLLKRIPRALAKWRALGNEIKKLPKKELSKMNQFFHKHKWTLFYDKRSRLLEKRRKLPRKIYNDYLQLLHYEKEFPKLTGAQKIEKQYRQELNEINMIVRTEQETRRY